MRSTHDKGDSAPNPRIMESGLSAFWQIEDRGQRVLFFEVQQQAGDMASPGLLSLLILHCVVHSDTLIHIHPYLYLLYVHNSN